MTAVRRADLATSFPVTIMPQAHCNQSANYTVGVCFLSRCTVTVHSPTAICSGH
jgi:hypothetical protein